jgi:hypothetical protein
MGVLFLCHFVNRAGNCYQIATVYTGSIKEIPDQFIIFKGCHNIKYLRATHTHVDGSQTPQIGSSDFWKGIVGAYTLPDF